MEKNNFLKVLNSIYLCYKFPFLYPRNRFTDKHRVNICNKSINKLFKKSFYTFSITGKIDKGENNYYHKLMYIWDIRIKLDIEQNKLIFSYKDQVIEHNISNLLWSNKFKPKGIDVKFSLIGTPIIIVYCGLDDQNDTTNYGFHYESVNLIKSKFSNCLYNIIRWLDVNIFDKFLFIPTYTELDAMPIGWQKAFGIQMCKDIKEAILKSGGRKYLKSYRIMQIKEKFGQLQWYDNGSTNEVDDVISKYESLSERTCIICGKQAKYMTPYEYWRSPYCSTHVPKDINKELLEEIV